MTGKEYQALAMRTQDKVATTRLLTKAQETDGVLTFGGVASFGGLIDGCLGLSGEVGEFNDLVKKWIFHETPYDRIHAQKELGDVIWYVAAICEAFGWTLDDIMEVNIEKLKIRYPEGFDCENANNRAEDDI